MGEETTRRPGRPRSARARRAVLDAALALAAGPGDLSMEAIAARAGVSKETLYRWWRSKTEVVLDVLAERGEETIPLPDTGALRGDLRAFLRSTADSADPATVALLRIVAGSAAADPKVADAVRDSFLAGRRAQLTILLERAVDRGELARTDVDLALDFIYGSLWYRLIFRVGPLDHRWADDIATWFGRASGGHSG